MTKLNVLTIIVNHNGKRYLRKCLESVSNIKMKGFKNKILLIDNASLDNSIKSVKKLFPKIKIKRYQYNIGFTGGVNAGFKYALTKNADYVLLLNYDTEVSPNFLNILINYSKKNPQAGIISPLITSAGKFPKIWFSGGKIDQKHFSSKHLDLNNDIKSVPKKPFETEFATGCCMLIKKEVLEKIGFFDDRYFLYYEDIDFSLRAKVAGYSCFVVPKSIIIHKKKKEEVDNLHKLYYLARNHLLFLRKHAPIKTRLREYLKTILIAFNNMQDDDDVKKQYELFGIKDYVLRRFGKREYWH